MIRSCFHASTSKSLLLFQPSRSKTHWLTKVGYWPLFKSAKDRKNPKPPVPREQLQLGTNDIKIRKGMLRPEHSWETSAAYLKSKEYRETYGDDPVWLHYRRNLGRAPVCAPPIRVNCLDPDGTFWSNWPCTVCRDEYLVLDFRNVELLRQYMFPQTGKPLPLKKANLCQFQHEKLITEIMKAHDHGTIEWAVPKRKYDYREYYSKFGWTPRDEREKSLFTLGEGEDGKERGSLFGVDDVEFDQSWQFSSRVYPAFNPDPHDELESPLWKHIEKEMLVAKRKP